ncbi:OmpA family protein [Herbaspirillum sp.]|uniref:OmpA family protein n=1 Tax=Herbaspirillum sp. TaxID=1890675 RepID=UPI0031E10529
MHQFKKLFLVCAIAMFTGAANAENTPPQPPVRPCASAPMLPDPLIDPQSPLAQYRTIYFDVNSVAIKDEFQSLIEAHGALLRGDPTRNVPSRRIRIMGNADDRGSYEYNQALGAARAEAVYRALVACGVQKERMSVWSIGRERIKAKGRDEASRAENRRVDIEYVAD